MTICRTSRAKKLLKVKGKSRLGTWRLSCGPERVVRCRYVTHMFTTLDALHSADEKTGTKRGGSLRCATQGSAGQSCSVGLTLPNVALVYLTGVNSTGVSKLLNSAP